MDGNDNASTTIVAIDMDVKHGPGSDPAAGTTAAALVLDSLPYIDETYDDYDQYAASLIEEEMKTMKPPAMQRQERALRHPTPLLQQEYQKLIEQNYDEKPNFNVKLKPPQKSTGTVEEWEEAVQKAKIELEKERIRGMMLEIEKEGVTAEQWKVFNKVLEDALQQGIEPLLQAQRQQVDQINLKRQEHQEGVGNRLYVLGSQYQQLVEKVYQLKRAVATMQDEIDSIPVVASSPKNNDQNNNTNGIHGSS
ncbi:hypothetical protein ACA910_015117 [Epithemia clementina (nom. ined.)]